MSLFVARPCANPECDRTIPASAPRSKQYCESRCKSAAWKARRASQSASGVVAVRSWVGDAENAQNGGLSKRAAELRQARLRGTVANDLRVQYARAVEVLAEYLRLLNIPQAERKAHEVMAKALPRSRRL